MKTATEFLLEHSGLQKSTVDNSFRWVVSAMEAWDKYLNEQYAHQQPVNDVWVRVEDALPKTGERVLCLCNTGLMRVGYLYKTKWEQDNSSPSFKELGYTVTHWRPLTEPPKQ